jgi:protein tyrosine phosphatase (PTP) superfamily phosphohydrolase (DUF442 family)
VPETAPSDPVDIYNWQRIDARLTSSGQPTEHQLAALARLGVSHVVNLGLHTHERALPDEADTVAALGMHYVHLPVAFDNPTEADFDRFRAIMDDLKTERVHIHCIANYRVSAFLYRYHRNILALPSADARERMERIWRPGGIWARFVADDESAPLPHRIAGKDY